MKKLLLLIILLAFIGWSKTSVAQSGNSCDSAKTALPDTIMVPQVETMTNGTVWYKYTAIDSNLTITLLELDSNPSNKILNIAVWKGSCSSLTYVASDTISSIYDSVLVITTTGVDSGYVYYVQITKSDTVALAKMMMIVNNNPPLNSKRACRVADTCEYVNNGDFETDIRVPTNVGNIYNPGQIYKSCFWSTANLASPDYYMSVAPPPFGVPVNGVNTVFTGASSVNSAGSLSGNAYAGINAYWDADTLSEYIQSQLKCKLDSGVNYTVSFWVHLASLSRYSVSQLGAAMSIGSIANMTTINFLPPPVPPIGSVISGAVINNATTWQHITGTYCALGGEDHITIGNFWPGNQTPRGFSLHHGAYYYIDGVSVSPLPLVITTAPSVCTGSTPVLTNNHCGAAFNWTSSIGWSCTGCSDPNPSLPSLTAPAYFGAYKILCDGCQISDTVLVTVDTLSSVSVENDTVTCGTVPHLTATGSPAGGTYSWSPTTGIASGANTASPTFNPINFTTTYTVTYTNGACGPSTATATIFVTCDSCTGTVIDSTTMYNTFPASISANTIYNLNHNITVYGTAVVLQNDVFNISSNVTITVASGASLTLDHCHLYACDTMWNGIVVDAGGSLIIIDSSLIEDAFAGVHVPNTSYSASTTLSVNGCTFNKNLVGILIDTYTPTTPVYPFTVVNAVFTCRSLPYTQFYWPSPASLKVLTGANSRAQHYVMGNYPVTWLPYPAAGSPAYAGISLDYVGTRTGTSAPYAYYDMIIGDGYTKDSLNVFDNMNFGINALNSNFTCYNNAFQYIQDSTGTPLSGIGYAINAYSSFTYLTENRIRVIADSANARATNCFYDCSEGVCANNYNEIAVRSTAIMSTPYSSILPIPHCFVGIWAETPNCTQVKLDANVITNAYLGIVFEADDYTGGTYSDWQKIGPVDISDNTVRVKFAGNPSREYNIWGIAAINNMNWPGTTALNMDDTIMPHTHNINVNRNHIRSLHNGIWMQNWLNYDLGTIGWGIKPVSDSNYIVLRQNIAFANTPPDPQYGIYHVMDWNTRVVNNNITGYQNTDTVCVGISCSDDIPFINQVVNCNYVDSLDIGIEFVGQSFTSQDPTDFYNNIMRSDGRGFQLDNTAIGPACGGCSTNGNDNEWTGTYSGASQYTTYTKNYADPTQSWLYIDSGSPTYDPTGVGICSSTGNVSYVYAIANGLTSVGTSSGVSCDIASSVATYAGNNKSLQSNNLTRSVVRKLEQMVNDSIVYSYFENEQHINGKFKAYQMLNMQPELRDSSVILHNFYNSATSSNIGKLANVTGAMSGGQASNAIAYLNSIMPQNAIEANYKNYYSVYLHYKMGRLSIADSIMLKTLVKGCPVRDGLIVYQARILNSTIYKDFNNYKNDCDDEAGIVKMKKTQNPNVLTGLNLYPNPTTGSFSITVKGVTSTSVELYINDISGKLISADKVILNGNSAIVDKGLNNGVYFISAKDANGNSIGNPKKITVIR